eukprot:2641534-Amphidinium_carterae.2
MIAPGQEVPTPVLVAGPSIEPRSVMTDERPASPVDEGDAPGRYPQCPGGPIPEPPPLQPQ